MNERCGKTHGRNFSCERENSIKAANEAAAVKDAECEECECKRRRGCEFSCPVCINTEQIYDACRDRDCVTDRRVYFTGYGQEIIDKAINVKPKSAEIIWVDSDVESVPFNKGYYAVDIKYFICITFDVYKGVSCPTEVKGLTTFDKRVILFGSEGSTKSFESTLNSDCNITDEWQKTNLPKAIVTAVDPIVLSATLFEDECCDCCNCCNTCGSCGSSGSCGSCKCNPIPKSICECFEDELIIDDDVRQVLVSFGLFTMVKIVRDVQLLIDAIDFCIPCKECPSATDENPCELFSGIRFPLDEFFPPVKKNNFANTTCEEITSCKCCDMG